MEYECKHCQYSFMDEQYPTLRKCHPCNNQHMEQIAVKPCDHFKEVEVSDIDSQEGVV